MNAKGLFAVVACVLVSGMAVANDDGLERPKSVHSVCFTDSALVSWSPVFQWNLTGYNVFRKASSESNYILSNPSPVTETSYAVTSLSGATTYEFRVTAIYDNKISSPMSDPAVCATG